MARLLESNSQSSAERDDEDVDNLISGRGSLSFEHGSQHAATDTTTTAAVVEPNGSVPFSAAAGADNEAFDAGAESTTTKKWPALEKTAAAAEVARDEGSIGDQASSAEQQQERVKLSLSKRVSFVEEERSEEKSPTRTGDAVDSSTGSTKPD